MGGISQRKAAVMLGVRRRLQTLEAGDRPVPAMVRGEGVVGSNGISRGGRR
jgi:hypothetical protein